MPRALSEKVSERLRKDAVAGRTVALKLKSHDFKPRMHNRQLADPMLLADRIFSTGLKLLRKEANGTRFPLIGIGASDLCGAERADPPDLVDTAANKRALVEGAVNTVRGKFGRRTVETGYTFGKGGNARPQRDRDA